MYFTGWSLGSDPDYQLGINTCDALPSKKNGSDSTTMDYWCNKEFDQLYAKQHAELDPEKRQAIVQQMQAIHYKSAPSIDFWYPDRLEAYRSDRFTNLTKQPTKGGIITAQSGYWAMYGATPVKDSTATNEAGLGAGGWTGIGVAAVLVIGGGAFLASRRKKTADERE
jgi:peptide/nickel transport system substrate-binding protein